MDALDVIEKKEARLEKYLDHLHPKVQKKLKGDDLDYLNRMRLAFNWRCSMFSPEQVRRMIMQQFELEYSQACRVYSDMQFVFGKVEEADKAAERKILVEYYHKAIQMAIRNGNEDGVMKATEKLAILLGLNEGTTLTPEQLMPARTVVYIEKAMVVNGAVKEVAP